MDLRVLTFNIRYDTIKDGQNAWGFRKDLALDLVRQQKCHIVGFQEVLPRQRTDLEANLPEYAWLGHGREADQGGEQCCLAVSPEFEIRDTGTFWLAPTPDSPGARGWDAELTRICTWARLAKGGVEFTVFNAHWDHRGEKAREESARLLLNRVMSVPGPVLLMGDFNTTPGSAPIAILTSALEDSYDAMHPGSAAGTFHGFGQVEKGDRIDYLLASPEFMVVDSQIIMQTEAPFPSDHFAVFASYELLPEDV